MLVLATQEIQNLSNWLTASTTIDNGLRVSVHDLLELL